MPKQYKHPFEMGDEFFSTYEDDTFIIHKIKCVRPLTNYDIRKVLDIIDDKILVSEDIKTGQKYLTPLVMEVAPPGFLFKDIFIQDGFDFEKNCDCGHCPCSEF